MRNVQIGDEYEWGESGEIWRVIAGPDTAGRHHIIRLGSSLSGIMYDMQRSEWQETFEAAVRKIRREHGVCDTQK